MILSYSIYSVVCGHCSSSHNPNASLTLPSTVLHPSNYYGHSFLVSSRLMLLPMGSNLPNFGQHSCDIFNDHYKCYARYCSPDTYFCSSGRILITNLTFFISFAISPAQRYYDSWHTGPESAPHS